MPIWWVLYIGEVDRRGLEEVEDITFTVGEDGPHILSVGIDTSQHTLLVQVLDVLGRPGGAVLGGVDGECLLQDGLEVLLLVAQVVHALTHRACGALKYPRGAVAELVGFIGAMVLGFGFRHSCLVRVCSGRAGIDLLGDLYLYLGRLIFVWCQVQVGQALQQSSMWGGKWV